MHAQLQHAHKEFHTSAGPVSAQQHRDVRAAARNRSGQYRQQDNSSQRSTDYEQLIAPVSTTDVSTVADVQYAGLPDYVAQVQLSRSSSSSSKGGRPGKPTSTRHDGRRGSLVKIRVPPRRYRLRQSFDSAQTLHIKPSDPEFVGRLTSEINSVYGPRRLGKIIQDFSEHFTTEHAAAAVSQLAGMVTGKDISPEQLSSVYKGPAAKVARVFEAKVQEASLQDCAKVIYSLARLQLHMPQLLSAVEQVTTDQLRRATPQALAGLAVGLAHWGCRPSEAWTRELCMESFAAIDGFSAQDLANLVFSLAVWKVSVSQPFLQRCLTAFRGHFGAAATTPAATVRFLYALTQLPACQDLPPKLVEAQPAGAPVYIHHDDYRHQRELHTLSGVMGLDLDAAAAVANKGAAASAAASAAAVGDPNQPQRQQRQQQPLQPQQPQQPQPPPMSAVNNSSGQSSSRAGNSGTAVATYRLPSFNWLTACLLECRRLIDRFKPAELSTLLWSCACLNHTPDLIFMEAWYRASAVRMHAFTPATLAAAVQALGMLQPGKDVPGAVSGRWLQLVLNHSQQMMQQQQGYPQTAPPPAAAGGDSEDNEQRQQQQQQLFSASDLSKLLWGLAELKIWPGKPWMDAWLQACGSRLTSATPSDLSDVTWALARLRFSPDDSWMTQLSTVISKQLQGFSVQGLAVVIWGYTRLGFRPDRLWLLRFRAVAGSGAEEGPASSSSGGSSSRSSSGQQLAQFVAAFLAQQNRQRFAEGRPPGKAAAVAAPAAAGGGRGAGRGRGRGRGSGGHNRQLG